MNTRIHILIIEDEKSMCSYIATFLKGEHYQVTSAMTGSEGIKSASVLHPDIILLDLGLPDMDGGEVLRHIRSWTNTPIIIVSARHEEAEKVKALDQGADDYITKPFGTNELAARIRTCLRRNRPISSKIYRALDLEIQFEKRIVCLRGAQIHLTQIEYQLLTLLAENAGRVLTYNFLMNAIWGPYIDDNNQILRVNMANIRRKIESNPAQPQYVFTEIGIGYRMPENECES